ncbi:MAG: NB-ARC domain-containing protein [Ktedonobacterales bacterium]
MARRAKRDQRLAEYAALAVRAERAAAGAAIATAGAIGSAAVQPVIEAAAPIGRAVGEAAVAPLLEAVVALKSGERETQAPEGPPFDESLLPPPARFVGRVDDRPWLVERLKAGGTTGITALGGIGGIGKTALAAVAIREARDAGRFHDGIAVILCQDKSDPVEVLRLALTRFDPFRREPKATDAAGLTDAARQLLAGKDALIVFDNVEPALSDRLAELVNPLSAGDATLLLTARQRLPSSVVPRDASRELDLLSDAEALDLFAQAYLTPSPVPPPLESTLVRPSLQSRLRSGRSLRFDGSLSPTGRGESGLDAAMLSATDRAAAARIVKALANHTLAVKLAGAYAGDCGRPLDTLAGEMEARPLDVPGDKGERAVAIIFRQSTDQLPEHAQRLFAALAALPTLEFGRNAALHVANTLGLTAPDSPNPVDVLVRRVLLDAETNGRMPPQSDRERLRLHPLLGAFAAEQLKEWPDDERSAAYLAVATHYAEYANETADAALSPDELNITRALEWADDNRQDALVVALCTGMQYYWRTRGRVPLSLAYLPSAVATATRNLGEKPAPEADADAWQGWQRRVHALFWLKLNLGFAYQVAGRLRLAEEQYGECQRLARASGNRRDEGAAISVLGQIALARGQAG